MNPRRADDHHDLGTNGGPAAFERAAGACQTDEVEALAYWGRVLAHPTRVALLRELDSMGEASPRLLADRLHQPLGNVSYHVRALRGWDVLELSGTTTRRGALEHRYRVARSARPVIDAMRALTARLRVRDR